MEYKNRQNQEDEKQYEDREHYLKKESARDNLSRHEQKDALRKVKNNNKEINSILYKNLNLIEKTALLIGKKNIKTIMIERLENANQKMRKLETDRDQFERHIKIYNNMHNKVSKSLNEISFQYYENKKQITKLEDEISKCKKEYEEHTESAFRKKARQHVLSIEDKLFNLNNEKDKYANRIRILKIRQETIKYKNTKQAKHLAALNSEITSGNQIIERLRYSIETGYDISNILEGLGEACDKINDVHEISSFVEEYNTKNLAIITEQQTTPTLMNMVPENQPLIDEYSRKIDYNLEKRHDHLYDDVEKIVEDYMLGRD